MVALVGDGECNEGSIWEAVLLQHHRLDNLNVHRGLQSFHGSRTRLGDSRQVRRLWLGGHDGRRARHGRLYRDRSMRNGPATSTRRDSRDHQGASACKQMEDNPGLAPPRAHREELPAYCWRNCREKTVRQDDRNLRWTDDPRLVLLLGDIGVFGFRNACPASPERTYNIGICEQAMTSLAAGTGQGRLVPVRAQHRPLRCGALFRTVEDRPLLPDAAR